MPIRVDTSTVTLPFRDSEGKDIEGATFTIRKRLSYDAMSEYNDAIFRLDFDAERGMLVGNRADSRKAEDVIVANALVSWSGIEDVDGSLLPVESWREIDPFYARQVVQAIQARNVGAASAGGSDPNASGASPASSAESASTPPAPRKRAASR